MGGACGMYWTEKMRAEICLKEKDPMKDIRGNV